MIIYTPLEASAYRIMRKGKSAGQARRLLRGDKYKDEEVDKAVETVRRDLFGDAMRYMLGKHSVKRNH